MRSWRIIVCSIYFNTDIVGVRRSLFLSILNDLAQLYHLECVAQLDNLLSGIPGYDVPSISTGLSDKVHLRSTALTRITRAQFSKSIETIFDVLLVDTEQEWIVCPLDKKDLGKEPFPRD